MRPWNGLLTKLWRKGGGSSESKAFSGNLLGKRPFPLLLGAGANARFPKRFPAEALTIRPEATEESERAVATEGQHSARSPRSRGFLNPQSVRGLAFWTTSLCILVAV